MFKSLFAGLLSFNSARKLKKAVDLILVDNEEAIRILDSIGASTSPPYGKEIISAAVFYYKGVALNSLKRYQEAKYYLGLVEEIPSWYVMYGKNTLKDIKKEARELKERIGV